MIDNTGGLSDAKARNTIETVGCAYGCSVKALLQKHSGGRFAIAAKTILHQQLTGPAAHARKCKGQRTGSTHASGSGGPAGRDNRRIPHLEAVERQ